MKYRISAPNIIKADVKLPSSKSISNRALVISAMAGDVSRLENLSDCDDTDVIVRALNDMPETSTSRRQERQCVSLLPISVLCPEKLMSLQGLKG